MTSVRWVLAVSLLAAGLAPAAVARAQEESVEDDAPAQDVEDDAPAQDVEDVEHVEDVGEAPALDDDAEPDPPLTSGAGRPFAWVALGLTVASVATSFITWAMANSRYDELVDVCTMRPCTEDDVAEVDTLVTLANVGIGASLGFFAAFVLLFYVEPSLWGGGGDDADVSVGIGPGSVHLRGRF